MAETCISSLLIGSSVQLQMVSHLMAVLNNLNQRTGVIVTPHAFNEVKEKVLPFCFTFNKIIDWPSETQFKYFF